MDPDTFNREAITNMIIEYDFDRNGKMGWHEFKSMILHVPAEEAAQ